MKTLLVIGITLLIDLVLFTLVIPYIMKMIIRYYHNRNNRTSFTTHYKQLVGGVR